MSTITLRELAELAHREGGGGIRWRIADLQQAGASRMLATSRALAPIRTGELRRSLSAESSVDGDVLALALASDHPAARVLDQGGRITGQRGLLAIPIPRDSSARRLTPEQVSGLRSAVDRAGRPVLRDSSGVRYALRSEVTIRGTRFMETAAANEAARFELEAPEALAAGLDGSAPAGTV
jgi:hypothetical protein